MKHLVIGLLMASCYLILPGKVFANVIITEVHPNPLSGPEWVELYNDSSDTVNLNNWTLEDQLANPSTVYVFTQQTLAAQTYFVANLSQAKLNNDKDGVTLKNNSGTVVDTMSYTSTSQGMSWSRAPSSASFTLANPTPNQPYIPATPSPSPVPTPTPTPAPSPSPSPTPTNSPNPSPTPIPNYLYLQPSEIMACPLTSEDEWLELYNPASEAVTLDNWQVRDSSDNSRSVSGTIPAHNFGHVTWSSGLLNNTGDSVSLLTPDEQTLFTAEFGSCPKNSSFIFANASWQVTSTVTLDEPNLLTTATTNQSPSPTPNILPTLQPLSSVVSSSEATPSPSPPITPAGAGLFSSVAQTIKSLTVPFTATSSLQLNTASPSATQKTAKNSPPTISLAQTQPNLPAILGVIIGGTVLTMTHAVRLYQAYFHAQTSSSNPFRALFP